MKKSLIVTIIVLLLVVSGVIYYYKSGGSSLTSNSQNLPSVTGSVIVASDLAKHNLDNDCWVAFQGKVYDITSFMPKHPGGPGKIAPLCGTSAEFEKAFLAKHGTSKISVLESQGILKGNFSA